MNAAVKGAKVKDHIRQGDVLTIEIDSLPDDVELVEREAGAVVLAHGEATGHRHAFYGGGVRMYATPSLPGATKERPARVLRLLKGDDLKHDEHTQIPHEKGLRRVVRQVEYQPGELVRVAD